MLGNRIKADEALRIGLVHKVVPPDKLDEETEALARKLSEEPSLALACAKYVINFGTQVPLDIGLKVESGAVSVLPFSKDFREGITAFFEKREPVFKGEQQYLNAPLEHGTTMLLRTSYHVSCFLWLLKLSEHVVLCSYICSLIHFPQYSSYKR